MSATHMEELWSTCALKQLKTSSSARQRHLYNFVRKMNKDERTKVFKAVVEDREYMASLRPLVIRDKIVVASAQTDELEEYGKGKRMRKAKESNHGSNRRKNGGRKVDINCTSSKQMGRRLDPAFRNTTDNRD